jgi:predicted transglutaminase-like cysteine proteinase
MRPLSPTFFALTLPLSLPLPRGAEGDSTIPEDPAQFESDPLSGGNKFITTSFKSLQKWDRVRVYVMGGKPMAESALKTWVDWAHSLHDLPINKRLAAINRKVNAAFRYQIDRKTWGKDDYWETPAEAVEKGRLDCEDFAIFKMYLAYAAGIEAEDMAILVGRIPRTGEGHAILLAGGNGTGYLLDNRSPYIVDTDTYNDFKVLYSIDFNDVWMFPALFQR